LLADTGAGSRIGRFQLILDEADCLLCGGTPLLPVTLGGAYKQFLAERNRRPPLRIHIYAIAKNEAAFAARFAASCEGADGIHVLDTGSTDDTVAILRAHGVHVEVAEVRPWRFDLARNLSLELVPDDADVCLSIDLDEC
jgi:hypothetical protein